jgi:hypothetical protein
MAYANPLQAPWCEPAGPDGQNCDAGFGPLQWHGPSSPQRAGSTQPQYLPRLLNGVPRDATAGLVQAAGRKLQFLFEE